MAAKNISRKTKVFISYSRKNKPFVRKLNKAIDGSGIEAWVDWEGIPLSADWMEEVTNAIKASDAFLFVISPDSLNSKVCAEELELAIKFNKKIIPTLYCEAEKRQKMHPKLASTNWVYMRPQKDDFKSTFPKLIESIQTDLGWVQQHTRLLQRAMEWEQKNRNRSYLLQGSDLSDAERWMIEATKDVTRSATPIQAEYINASRKEAMKRQRNLTIGVGLALTLSILLSITSIYQTNRAEQNLILANSRATAVAASAEKAKAQEARAKESEAQARENENEAKAQRSAMQAGIYEERPGELFTSTRLALESWQRLPSTEAENVLRGNLSRMAVPVAQVQRSGRISNIHPSGDGQYFVAASDDGTACLWTLQAKQKYCVQHNGIVNDAILSTDNTYLVTAGTDGFLNVWDGKNGTPIRSIEYKSNILDIELSGNGKWLALGRDDGFITLIDFAKLKEEVSFDMGSSGIQTLAFSPKSDWLAFGMSDGQTTIWRVNAGVSSPGPKHNAGVSKVRFSPDGEWVLSVGADNTARAAKTITAGTKYVVLHNNMVEDAAFSPDGSWFVTASNDKLLRVFTTETGREKFRMEHAGPISRVEVSPNGQWIAATGPDNRVLIWDATSGTLVREIVLDSAGTALAFSANDDFLIAGESGGRISVWDVSTLDARIGYIEFKDPLRKAKFSYTGEWVLFNTDDKNLWVIPTDKLTTIHDGTLGTKLLSLENTTNQTKVSPDSKWIAFTENEGHTANLFNIETSVRHTLPHETNVSGIGFSGDGKLFATTREKGTSVFLWDVESGQQVEEIRLNGTAFTISFNPSDATLAIGLSGKFIIWDTVNKKEIASFEQIGDLKSLNFSRDGHWLATTSSAGGISIWDMSNGLPIEPAYKFLQGGSITSLDFSADGQLLASGGSNGYAYLWDLNKGEEWARLPHKDSVSGVSFSPTDNHLITVSQDIAQVWDVSKLELITTGKLNETACAKLNRNFSESEWRFFFPNEEYRTLCPALP